MTPSLANTGLTKKKKPTTRTNPPRSFFIIPPQYSKKTTPQLLTSVNGRGVNPNSSAQRLGPGRFEVVRCQIGNHGHGQIDRQPVGKDERQSFRGPPDKKDKDVTDSLFRPRPARVGQLPTGPPPLLVQHTRSMGATIFKPGEINSLTGCPGWQQQLN